MRKTRERFEYETCGVEGKIHPEAPARARRLKPSSGRCENGVWLISDVER